MDQEQKERKPKSRKVVAGPVLDEKFEIERAERVMTDFMDLLVNNKELMAKAKKKMKEKVDMFGRINSISDIETAKNNAFKEPDSDGEFENELEYEESEPQKVKKKLKKEEYD